jgi:hypothetical protein
LDKETFVAGFADCLSDAIVQWQETADPNDPMTSMDPNDVVFDWVSKLFPGVQLSNKRVFKRRHSRRTSLITPVSQILAPRAPAVKRLLISQLQCSLTPLYYHDSTKRDALDVSNNSTSELEFYFTHGARGRSIVNYSLVSGVAGSSASASRSSTLNMDQGANSGFLSGNLPKQDVSLGGLRGSGTQLTRQS